jgi:diguanylate cyclase (GGDEF)-like protein/PAS domain S-box-containing protein
MPPDELDRLAALRDYHILDTAPEDAYDDIVRLAAFICGTPIATVTLVDAERQWFKAAVGLTVTETPRDIAFCAHTILQPDMMIVPDAAEDARFADNPFVTGDPHIRFYAGVPLITESGHALGSLCVIDRAPRRLTADQEAALRTLAHQVVNNLELGRRAAEQDRLIAEREQAIAARRHSEENFQAAFDNAAVGASIIGRDGSFITVNKAFCSILGYTLEEALATDFAALTHPDDLEETVMLMEQLLEGRIPNFVLEKRCLRGDGSYVWTQNSVSLTYDELGHPQNTITLTEDISERKAAAQVQAETQKRTVQFLSALEANQGQMALILDNVEDTVFLLGVGPEADYRFLFVNLSFMKTTGLRAEQIIGRRIQEVVPVSSQALILDKYAEAIRERRPVEWQETSAYPLGECVGDVRVIPIFDESDRCAYLLGTVHDVTDRKRAEDEQAKHLLEARERADRDPLTSLLNHRAFQHRLNAEADRAQRENTILGVVMLDLDNFKFFNDVYGHAIGDQVLRAVAERLTHICRPYDTLARFGGDEFALLLPNVHHATATEVEARLRSSLQGLSYYPEDLGAAIPISVSVGAALFPDGDTDCHAVLHRADERLILAKTGGDTEETARRFRMDAVAHFQGFSMLDALVTAVDNKDRYTRRHSEDVMEFCLLIMRELDMDEREQRTVAVAALLHDVGKIGVPDHILRKPGRLTAEEFEAIKLHPMMGSVMVSSVPGLEATLDAVRHHHERWDGEGYPFGLRGEEIPLIARLMAVADAFSAMTTDRPYREGMERQKALRILQDGAGTQWDPVCVRAFLQAQQNQK